MWQSFLRPTRNSLGFTLEILLQTFWGQHMYTFRYPALASLPEIGNDLREMCPKLLTAFLNISLGLIKERNYLLPRKSGALKSLDHHGYNSNNDFITLRCAVFYWAECFPSSSQNVQMHIQLPFKRQLQVSWGYAFPLPHILCILLPNHNHWNVIST